MASWYPARQLQRDDRYVHHCHLRGGGEISRTRLQFYIEEALRLVSLPGENEGRTYYFRRVTVTGVSPRASRQDWISAFQTVLTDLGSRPIHGSDPRAADANVVFFQNSQEALEVLLAKTLRRNPTDAWFWPQVSGAAEHMNRPERVLAIIQKLIQLPASWQAVADSVFAAIGSGDPLTLLTMLPASTAHGWLQQLGPADITRDHPRPVHLRQTVAGILLQSVKALGSADPRVMWLATLAVMQVAPAEPGAGAVMGRARATLNALVAQSRIALQNPRADRDAFHSQSPSDELLSLVEDDAEGDSPPGSLSRTRVRFNDVEKLSAQEDTIISQLPGAAQMKSSEMELPSCPADSIPQAGHRRELQNAAETLSDSPNLIFSPRESLAEATEAAGLPFLLNALIRLHVAEALARNSIAAGQGLVAHIMQQLALHAGVEQRDPAWRWIAAMMSQIPPTETPFLTGAELFPPNLSVRPEKLLGIQDLARLWCVAIRRWCWRFGRITVHEVVNRQGLLLLNRTDLDVTLPLDSVDLRIRRAGLDLDPGWLPWLGKVVRFHYV